MTNAEIIRSRFKKFLFNHKWFLLSFIALGVFFKFFPQIDIYISNLFYNEDTGFFLNDTPAAMTIYNAVNYITIIVIILYAILLFIDIKFKKTFFIFNRKAIIFLLITLILGPGIVVNSILKEQVGRPRPEAITQFGGTDTFVAPFTFSNACDGNCSFVSGHAALGFYFMAFAFLFKSKTKRNILSLTFIIGVIVSLTRIIQGRHFFTDTLFAFFFVYAVIILVYELMYGNEENS